MTKSLLINRILTLVMILALSAGFLVPGRAQAASPAVFINEIHYDNASTDTGEAVEIAGPAGTDLSGWSLVLYNGSGGTPYTTTLLSGTIPDIGGGFGVVVVNYPENGLQNGSPDGLALVDAGSNVIQFLSYEGSFLAVGGPADGQTSVDIGVAEGSATPIGYSLQLTGSGEFYDDFTWIGEGAQTFGSFNTGQTFSSTPVPEILVINEIDYDQPGTDTAEFIEIRNNGNGIVNLSGWSLELVNGTGGGASIYQTISLPAVNLAVGDYFVVCGDSANVVNCDLDVSPDSNLVQNGAPDAVGLRFNGELKDAVSYEGDTGAPYTEISAVGLEDPGTTGSDYLGISRFPDGTDTNINNLDLSLRCSTPGEANSANTSSCIPPETNLVINEIDYDQPGTDAAEFIEIRNNGTRTADLTGWTLELVNGSNGAIYETFLLDGYTLAAGDYFVVCGDSANVANCDMDVTPDTNLVQNGAPDAVGLRFNGVLVDAVSYEGDTIAPYTEGSGVGLVDSGVGTESISRCEDGTDTNQNNLDFITSGITPGAANDCPPPPPPEVCGDPATVIGQVQGNGYKSPLLGSEVAIEGIVVGDFQNNGLPDSGDLNGFYVQDLPANADPDPLTSDGMFIYAPGATDVSVGDHVRLRGTVSEYVTSSGASSMTQLTGLVLQLNCGTAAVPAPAEVLLPVNSKSDLEAYEGMLVTFTQPLYISEYYNFGRYGEIVLTTERQFQPTAVFEPYSPEADQLAIDNQLGRITLDDGRSVQNPDPAIHPNGLEFTLDNLFRGGDIVQGATGVIDDTFALYRIQPTQGANYIPMNPRTEQPEDVGGNLKVASFNVLNYFTTLNSRGANTPEEFTRQRDKIFAALAAMDADVVGLIEIENNGDALLDLVDGLNNLVGAETYAPIVTGPIGTDEITVAFIYKPASVSLVGNFAVLDDPSFTNPLGYVDDDGNLIQLSRPALAQTFMDNTTGGVFSVVVNHLKSKGSTCNTGAYDDDDPVQGNCNLTRALGATALVNWLATDPTGSGDSDFLIMGDLNAYDKEDPVDNLLAGGFTDLVNAYQDELAYSYVFDGQLGYLDSALASPGLLEEVTGTTVWHINADEASLIDYDMTFKADAQDALYADDAYRSSDHDPVIIGLSVCDEIAPTIEASVTPDLLWPPNHKYVEVTATIVASDNFDPNPVITLVSVTSNEPDNGLGDGDTPNDIVILDTFHVLLRAERSAHGTGRVYTLTYKVTDACGNETYATASVFVPLNMSKN